MNATERARLADDLLRRLAAAIRGAQLYAPGHTLVTRSITSLLETLTTAHQHVPSVTIGIVGEDLVVGDIPIRDAASNAVGAARNQRHPVVQPHGGAGYAARRDGRSD